MHFLGTLRDFHNKNTSCFLFLETFLTIFSVAVNAQPVIKESLLYNLLLKVQLKKWARLSSPKRSYSSTSYGVSAHEQEKQLKPKRVELWLR